MYKILIADDDIDIRNSMKSSLERSGYEVLIAEDGTQALELIFQESPDLIIIDILMPGIDGIKTLEELQKNKNTRNIPIIMISGARNEMDLMKGLLEMPIVYIEKPFSREKLLGQVEQILIKYKVE